MSIQSIDQLWRSQIYIFKGTAGGEDAQSVCVCVWGMVCQVQMRSAYRLSAGVLIGSRRGGK